MLTFMRKQAKSWMIKFIIGLLCLVFTLYFGSSYFSRGAIVAEVNGESITLSEYNKEYNNLLNNLRKEYGSAWSDKLVKTFDLKNRALEDLIQKKLMSQEAKKIGLRVTDNEIRQTIMGIAAFQINGRFSDRAYRAVLADHDMTPNDFEKSITQSMLYQKLEQFLSTFLILSDQEILDNYKYSHQKVKLAFVNFSPDEFKGSIKKDPAKMKSFFEERKKKYRIPAKIRIAYITIDPDKFRDKVKIDKEELKDYYYDNMDRFTQKEEIRVRHILFKVPPGATPREEEKIKEKAESVLEKAKKGADFAKLAREYSEGPTKSKGGDLGYFSRGQMLKPFEDAAFKLKKGEISGLVRTSLGYHIIKMVDIKKKKVKKFDEVRDQIVKIITKNKTMDLAYDKGVSLIDQLPYGIDLTKYAAQNHVPSGETGFFSRYEQIPLIGGDAKLMNTLFSLQKGETTDLVTLNNKYYIIEVIDKKASYIPKMADVKTKVEADYTDYMALKAAKSAAEKYLEALKKGKSWDELAKEQNKSIESTNFFTRSGSPDKIGSAPGIQDAAFKLTKKSPYADTVFENYKGAFVIKWAGTQGIDKDKFNEDKQKYTDSLRMQKRQAMLTTWLHRLEARADIDRSNFKQYE